MNIQHPFTRRALQWSALTLALTLLSSCKISGGDLGNVDVGKVFSAGEKLVKSGETSEAEEIELGAHMAATLLGAAPLDKDLALQKYVNRIGRYVANQSGRPQLKWYFGVLADDGYNAFAAPGGYIFVTRGLLRDLRSEAELAGVLAHEITHVVEKHHLNALKKGNRIGALGDLGSALADATIENKGGGHTALKKEAAQKVVNLSKEIYSRGLDKEDEFEADRKGVKLAAASGYDPYALLAVLQRLDAQSAENSSFALMFKTHPKAQDRLQALDKTVTTGFAEAANASNEQRYRHEIKL